MFKYLYKKKTESENLSVHYRIKKYTLRKIFTIQSGRNDSLIRFGSYSSRKPH